MPKILALESSDLIVIEKYPGQFSVSLEDEKYCILKYNLGASLFLLPAVWIDIRLGFLIVFITFLGSIFWFKKLLELKNLNQINLLFFVFFPAFVFHSRTLYSEIFAIFFVTAFLYFFEKHLLNKLKSRYQILSGVCLGFAVLIRYTNFLPLFIFGALSTLAESGWLNRNFLKQVNNPFWLLLDWFKEKKWFLLTGIPFALFFFWVNHYMYGGVLHSGYAISGEETFWLGQIPDFLLRYFLALNLVYPFMLVSILFSRLKFRWTYLVAGLSTVVLYSSYPLIGFGGSITNLATGFRFILPSIPFFLLVYSSVWERIFNFKWGRGIFLLGIFLAGMLVILTNVKHQDFLTRKEVDFNTQIRK